jgi:hypothetical protein
MWISVRCPKGGRFALLAMLAVAAGCAKEMRTSQLPPFTRSQIDSIPFANIRAYVARLSFNPHLGAADAKAVDFAADSVLTAAGPDTIRIEPVIGAYRFDSVELAQGRIVARIWSDRVDSTTGIGPWWTYWWIDGATGTRPSRSLFLSDNGTKLHKDRFPGSLTYPDLSYHPECARNTTCALIRTARTESVSITACYDCGGYWCSTKPR